MKSNIFIPSITFFIICILGYQTSAQNASRLIRSKYFGYNQDSTAFIEGAHTDYIYNSNTRGINHYKNATVESGYALGELDMDYLYDTSVAHITTLGVDSAFNQAAFVFNSDNFVISSQNGHFTLLRNSTNRITELDFNSITGNTVVINRKTTYTYNGNNNVTSQFTQDSIGGTNNFRPVLFDTAFYDGSNRIIRHDIYYWYSGVKMLNGILTYTYDNQGRIIHKGNKSIYNGSISSEDDDSTVYDGSGKMIESFAQTDTFGHFLYRVRYHYNTNGDNDSALTYFNDTTNFLYIRNYYSYDNQHRVTQHQFILGTNSTKEEYTYNSFNQVLTEINYTGDGTNWTPSNRYEYTYELYNDNFSSVDGIQEEKDIQLYPNPNEGNFQLHIAETLLPNAELRLYDLAGKAVFFAKINSSDNFIHTPSLQKGMYVAIISNSKTAYSRKVVIQ